MEQGEQQQGQHVGAAAGAAGAKARTTRCSATTSKDSKITCEDARRWLHNIYMLYSLVMDESQRDEEEKLYGRVHNPCGGYKEFERWILGFLSGSKIGARGKG